MSVFSASYLLRFIYDLIVTAVVGDIEDYFKAIMVQMYLLIIFDIVPISLILYYHYMNNKSLESRPEQPSHSQFNETIESLNLPLDQFEIDTHKFLSKDSQPLSTSLHDY